MRLKVPEARSRLAKRKKRQAALDPFKAIARVMHSRRTLSEGFSHVRSTLKPAQVEILLEGILGTPAYRPLVTHNLFPTSVTDFRLRIPDHSHNGFTDFLWSAQICRRYASELNSFIVARDGFYNELIAGEYDSAESRLEGLERQFGVSLWSIESRLALLQARDGLAAQRAHLDELVGRSGVDRVVAYLAYWYSFRADPNVSRVTVDLEIKNILDDFGTESAASNLFCFALDPNTTEKLNPFMVVFGWDNAPLFDRYNALSRMVLLEYVRTPPEARQGISQILRILAPIEDPLLQTSKLLSLGVDVFGVENAESTLRVFDHYTTGDYESARLLALEDLTQKPASSVFHEVYARASASIGKDASHITGDSVHAQGLRAIQQLTTFDREADTAPERIERLALFSPLSTFGLHMAALSAGTQRFSRSHLPTEVDMLWALAGPAGNPWHLEALKSLAPDLILNGAKKAASASPSLRLRLLLLGFVEEKECDLQMPPERAEVYRGHLAMSRGDYASAITNYSKAAESTRELTALSARSFLFAAYMADQQYAEALSVLCTSYYLNSLSSSLFEVPELISTISADESLNGTVRFANAVHIAVLDFDQKYESLLSDTYERCLHHLGITRPSQLLAIETEESTDLLFFLRHVASVRVMEDSTEFEDFNEIESERVTVLSWLLKAMPDQEREIEQEIRSLIRTSQISAVRSQLEQTKIDVDEAGIRQKIQPALRERYARFVRLAEVPEVDYQSDQITKRLSQLFEGVETSRSSSASYEIAKVRLPSTERNGLLSEAYLDVLEWFLLSPEFGLDAHLSSNIRHGTFLGHTRGPFLKRRLLISEDSKAESTHEKDYWESQLASLDFTQKAKVLSALKTFTRWIEELTDDVNDEMLHVKVVGKDRGLFVFDRGSEVQANIASSLGPRSTYDEFVDVLFDTAWTQADASMLKIREYLAGDFSSKIYAYCDRVEQALDAIISRQDGTALFDAIAQARTEFGAALARIVDWFHRPQRSESEPFGFDLAVEVAIKELQSCYPEYTETPESDIKTDLQIRGRKLDGCVEILFILMQNALKRSGNVEDPNIRIEVESDARTLILTVTNSLGDDVDLSERQEIAKQAQARYNGNDALEKVREEGGSGLSKIWRTAEHILKVDHTIDLAVDPARLFRAQVLLDIENLQ